MRSSDPESRIADQGRIGETARLDHALMLLADARLPTGAHAVSGGLEAALLVGGLTSADIADYLRTRLVTAVPVDAGVAVLARRAVAAGPSSSSSDDALGLADAWAARTPAPAVRDAARLAGRGAASTPAAPPTGRGRGHVAAAARRAGRRMAAARPRCPRRRPRARRRRTALALAYDEVGSIASAALKLLPLDPLTSVDWSFGAADDIAAAVEVAVGISGVEGLPALAAPQLEAWQQCHATHDRRLFHA